VTAVSSTPPTLARLQPTLDAVPGTVSVWCGPPGRPPVYARLPDEPHYAASTMKVAVMAAAYRLAEAGRLDLDAEVLVHDEFPSALGDGTTYRSTADYDNDPQPWERLGRTARLRWLVRRMIVRSSNLATNLVLERVGMAAVAEVWAAVGARRSTVARGIQDYAAEDAGLSNVVTASDLAALLAAVYLGARRSAHGDRALASPEACEEMLSNLLAQEVTDDVVRGLPPGTAVAHKNGWVDGIRHSAAVVLPPDAPAYVLVTCVSAPLGDEEACDLVARVAAASWSDRRLVAGS
jgi:beta-lactamase class A